MIILVLCNSNFTFALLITIYLFYLVCSFPCLHARLISVVILSYSECVYRFNIKGTFRISLLLQSTLFFSNWNNEGRLKRVMIAFVWLRRTNWACHARPICEVPSVRNFSKVVSSSLESEAIWKLPGYIITFSVIYLKFKGNQIWPKNSNWQTFLLVFV